MDGIGWDLCAGLFYEHRFAMLIIEQPGKFSDCLESFQTVKQISRKPGKFQS